MTKRVYPTRNDAVNALEKMHGPRAALWTYYDAGAQDAGGAQPVGVVVRWNLANGKKLIYPVSRTPPGWTPPGWIIGAMSEPRPLYRLPDLLKRPNEPVYVVEGEKCADAAAKLGLLATTSAGGANAAGESDWTPLAGREVVILPDNDAPGEKYAADVLAALTKLTPPATVRIVNLPDAWPDLPDKGDIADIVARGEDQNTIKAKLAALVNAAVPEPQPQPQPGPAVEPWRPFPVDSLPAPLRRFVRELAMVTGNDPSCAALAALVTTAGVIGNRVAAHVKRGWVEPSILWGAIVARSGTTKSAILKLAARPLIEQYKRDRAAFSAALQNYNAERERYEAERERWKAAQKKGDGPGDPPVEPSPPIERRTLVSDVTCEKLAVLLQENPLGLLLVRDELAAWIGSFDRYAAGGKGSDAPVWLSFFDGAPVVVDRKCSTRTIFVEHGAVSVLGTIQPGTLQRVFGSAERESGLLARLLLTQPPTQPATWTDAELSAEAAETWAATLRGLMDLQPGTDEQGGPRPRLIPLAEDAKSIYITWHDAHGRDTAEIHADDLAAHFGKLKGICIRLALICACVDGATGAAPVEAIGRKHIEQAIAITDWLKNEARRVYGMLSESDEKRDQRRLAELIERRGGSVTVRELQQTSRLFRTAGEAESALDALAEAGVGRWEEQGPSARGGRPTRIFHLNAPAPSTQPPEIAPPAPTKPPFSIAPRGFVDVGAVDARDTDGGDWGEV